MTLRHRIAQAYLVCLFVYDAPLINAQPVPCAESNGKGIVACVESAYPERLKAGVSTIERQANMAFLRDRIIETARCRLLDVGLNCKRGNCQNLSFDFIAWKHDGLIDGVDIGAAYDDTTKPLRLTWHTYGPPNYGYPTYKAYGPVSCVIPPPPESPPPPTPAPDWEALKAQIGVLSEAVNALQINNAILSAQIDALRTALPVIESRVLRLETKPVPTYRCRGRIAFGIPVSCTVTLEDNP